MLASLAEGGSVQEILDDFPTRTELEIVFAAASAEEEYLKANDGKLDQIRRLSQLLKEEASSAKQPRGDK